MVKPLTSPAATRAGLISWPAAGALILLALSLRLIFPSLSVLLPDIMLSAGLSGATAGYITAVPMFCLGLFAPMASICIRHFGIERTLALALFFLAVGTAARGVLGLGGLFCGTLLAGGCIAICNVLLPVLVKRDFAAQAALITGLYVTAMNLGSAAAAGMTIPLMQAWNVEWPTALSLWAVPTALIALIWLPYLKNRDKIIVRSHPLISIWRDRLAWHVTIYMGLQSSMAYVVLGWMAPILRSRGLDPTTAGIVTSTCIIANLIGNLFAPILIRRAPDQRVLSMVLALGCGVSLIFLLFATPRWIWPLSVFIGFTQGATFATALTIIVLRSPNTETATLLSGMAQAAGYTIGAVTPLLVGLIYHWSGSFSSVSWLLAIVTLGTSTAGWLAGQNKYVIVSSLKTERLEN
ncbi:MFS transporter [Allopusillimonas ginsengisoli]|nr:MFS transporter [Allopusillimonas ginsengisoli]